MAYLKSFFFNVFAVFLANYVLPGINVTSITKLPHVGWDLLFAVILGLLNSSVYALLKVISHATILKILGVCTAINFIVYALVKVLPIGIHIDSFTGYLLVSSVVSLAIFLINFFEMRNKKPRGPDPIAPQEFPE